MKYSFNTWVYSDFPNWVPSYPMKDTIERLARIGYDALEIGCAQPHAWPYFLDAAKRKEMKKWLTDNKIAVSSMLPAPGGGPGGNIASSSREEREWTIQYWKDCLDLGLDLDCKILLCVCGWYIFGTKQRDAWKYAVDGIGSVADYAAGKGVTLCLEPTATDSNLVESADDAVNMMEDIGRENVKLMFDTAHALYRNEVPSDYVYIMGSDLKHVHFTDYDRQAPGTAGCDFFPVMQALKDVGFDGYVTMENGFASRSTHADSIARISLENLKLVEAALE
jgi:protein FrlC